MKALEDVRIIDLFLNEMKQQSDTFPRNMETVCARYPTAL